jgi:peptidyl-prolyl cis-trans isomerase SurA
MVTIQDSVRNFNMRNKLFYLLSLSSALFCSNLYAANAQALDQMVAVVNDDVITTSELNQAVGIIKAQIATQNVGAPSDKVLKKQVLDQLIDKKLQMQLAKQAGIDITDEDVNKAVMLIAKQNNISVDTLYEKLKQEGMSTKDYRAELHDQLIVQKLQQQEVASKITISPQEVTTFLNSHAWQANNAHEYRIEDILVPVTDSPTPDDLAAAKKRALTILSKLKSGSAFESIAQSESGSKNALQGGDLGWRQLPEIPSAFTAEVSHMRKNDVAGPIQTPNGFHLIKLVDTRSISSEKKTLDRKAVENLLLQQKFEEAMVNWSSRLRSQAFINIQPQKQWS